MVPYTPTDFPHRLNWAFSIFKNRCSRGNIRMNSCNFTIGEEWERFLLELSFQQAVARRSGTRTWWVVFPASLCCIFFDCKIGFFSKLAQIIKILSQIYYVVLSHVDRKAIGFAPASNIFKRDQTINGPNEPRGRRAARGVGILSCRGCKWTLRQQKKTRKQIAKEWQYVNVGSARRRNLPTRTTDSGEYRD